MLHRGFNSPVDIDEIPQIEVLDVVQQPPKRIAKTEKQSIAKSPQREESKKADPSTGSNRVQKKAMIIGDHVYTENQKRRPTLNQTSEASPDVHNTPISHKDQSNKSSVVSGLGNFTKDSDKEQQ